MAESSVSIVLLTLIVPMCITISSQATGFPFSPRIGGSEISNSFCQRASTEPCYSRWVRLISTSFHRRIFTRLEPKMSAMTPHGTCLCPEPPSEHKSDEQLYHRDIELDRARVVNKSPVQSTSSAAY